MQEPNQQEPHMKHVDGLADAYGVGGVRRAAAYAATLSPAEHAAALDFLRTVVEVSLASVHALTLAATAQARITAEQAHQGSRRVVIPFRQSPN